MSFYLRNTLLLTKAQSLEILTAAEWDAAETNELPPQIPFRITLNEQGKFVSAERTDSPITVQTVGMNPVIDAQGNTTLDALITPVNKGGFIPALGPSYGQMAYAFIIPFNTPNNSVKGYVHEDFRLKQTYLPCPLGTKAGEKLENGCYALATIDTETQTIDDIDYNVPAFKDEKRFVGTLMHEKEGKIVVACYLANGGCNFMRVIK